jgi:ornithine cyclodeaminase/alanine dehydrogenase-like protein (mu-crystallin family)
MLNVRRNAKRAAGVYRAIQTSDYPVENLSGEIGDVVAVRFQGRLSDDDLTTVKFVGIGAQDLAAASIAVEKLGVTGC